jgi:uncharacterized integral membrane protein (TIGR00698 family)
MATLLGDAVPTIGAPVMGLLIGTGASAVGLCPEEVRAGAALVGKRVLQGSIVILGLGLSLGEVLATGASSLPVLLGTLLVALVMSQAAGKALGVKGDLRTLIGVGTGICGASAIGAIDAVVGAEEADVNYAITTIFIFNVVAVLLYPVVGHHFNLSQKAFGLWAGTAINDTSSVVAASTVYGHMAASYGVVVKLTRTLAIIPVASALALWRHRRSVEASAGPGPRARPLDGRALVRAFPTFVLVFVVAVLAKTFGLVPTGWAHGLSDVATWAITAALAGIGLCFRLGDMRRAGVRPLALGAVLWLTVGLTSLGLQLATGTI